MMLYFN